MYVIDRFEGKWAVVAGDGGEVFNLPKDLLPDTAREGDVVRILVQVDPEETMARRERIRSLLKFDK